MVFPIVAYGSPILRRIAKEIVPGYPGLDTLIKDMWETMYFSNGVGLAAPQINRSIRVFVVDSQQIVEGFSEEEKKAYADDFGVKEVFINPKAIDFGGQDWSYNEGCLSIPKIRDDVRRSETITLEYQNEQFESFTKTFSGVTARVIMHEYDHLEGKLFIDYLPSLKRRLIQGKLNDISKGRVKMDYRLVHPR